MCPKQTAASIADGTATLQTLRVVREHRAAFERFLELLLRAQDAKQCAAYSADTVAAMRTLHTHEALVDQVRHSQWRSMRIVTHFQNHNAGIVESRISMLLYNLPMPYISCQTCSRLASSFRSGAM